MRSAVLTSNKRWRIAARRGITARRGIAVAVISAATGCSAFSPTGPNTIAPPASGVFAGTVYPDGRTRWPFTLTAPATVALTLTSVEPAPLILGLAFGDLTGRGCNPATAVEAKAGGTGPHVTVTTDAGEKCVEVFDIGGVPSTGAPFTVTIRGF